jgi:hypothetical protein
MSAPLDSRPLVADSTPDRSTSVDSREKAASRPDLKAPAPLEPHWERVIASATD